MLLNSLTKMKKYYKSIVGGRQENQDYADFRETKFGFLSVVCDGMGGANGGALASKLAIEVIIEDMSQSKSEDPVNALFNAIHKANFEIFRRSIQNPDTRGMGTTLTCLLLTKEKAYVCHVGDSRVYQFRDSQIIFRTNDHSKVYEMVKRGIITEEESKTHPESNIITRALGIEPVVDIELNERPFKIGDRFLLCTDGVHGLLSDAEIIKTINVTNVVDATNKLIEKANQKGIEGGGEHDNMTAAIVELEENSTLSLIPNKNYSLKKWKYAIIAFICSIIFISVFLYLNEIFRVNPIKNQMNNITKKTEQSIHIFDSIKKNNTLLNKSINNLNDSIDNLTKKNKLLETKFSSTKKKLNAEKIKETENKKQQQENKSLKPKPQKNKKKTNKDF